MNESHLSTKNTLLTSLERKFQNSLTLSSLKSVNLNYEKYLSSSKILSTENRLLGSSGQLLPKRRKLCTSGKYKNKQENAAIVALNQGTELDTVTNNNKVTSLMNDVPNNDETGEAVSHTSSYMMNYQILRKSEEEKDSCARESSSYPLLGSSFHMETAGFNKFFSKSHVKFSNLDKDELIESKIKLVQLGNVSIIIDTKTLLKNALKFSYVIVKHDPEFILKVALYLREDLYIRPGANALLACAAFFPECCCYLKRYFNSIVKTPADWIDIAVFYKAISGRNLCSALKSAMCGKFMEFDEYQLAKYAKKSRGKKKSNAKLMNTDDASDEEIDEDEMDIQPSHKSPSEISVKGSNSSNNDASIKSVENRSDISKSDVCTKSIENRSLDGQDSSLPVTRNENCESSEKEMNQEQTTRLHDNIDVSEAAELRSVSYHSNDPVEEEDMEDNGSKTSPAKSENSQEIESIYDGIYLDINMNEEEQHSGSDSEPDCVAVKTSRKMCTDAIKLPKKIIIGKRPTMKNLVRLVHASQPAYLIMSLLGKKYPSSREQFNASKLPGTFQPELSGTRMKLETPKTWEVLCAQHGNQAHVWKTLLDENKLPYLALLKNVRNIIMSRSNISYHARAIGALTNRNSVTKNQIPVMTFYTTYIAVKGLEYIREDGKANGEKYKSRFGNMSYYAGLRLENKLAKLNFFRDSLNDYWQKVIQMYLDGLNKCIETSACYNYQPLPGSTLILLMFDSYSSAESLETKALIVALTVYYICENAEFYFQKSDKFLRLEIDRKMGFMDILTKLKKIIAKFGKDNDDPTITEFVQTNYFKKMLNNKIKVDRILFFHTSPYATLDELFSQQYELLVNPDVQIVEIEIMSKNKSHDVRRVVGKNINLCARDDAIIKFLSSISNTRNLAQIEQIDKRFNLPAYSVSLRKLKPIIVPKALTAPRWKEVRVFISSTFLDMHGERNVLVRHVFPVLKQQAEAINIRLVEIDFRWGITEEEAQTSRALEMCLKEIGKCDLFIGIIGDRYGWIPNEEVTKSVSLKLGYPLTLGTSITEMEMEIAALKDPDKARDVAFFYIRDNNYGDIPSDVSRYFSETPDNQNKLRNLKNKIRSSGLEVMDSYSCSYGGYVGGLPTMAGLNEFSSRVITNVWNALVKLRPEEYSGSEMELVHLNKLEELRRNFVGYDKDLSKLRDIVKTNERSLSLIVGEEGQGKSAFLAQFHSMISADITTIVYLATRDTSHFSSNSFFNYLCVQLSVKCGVQIGDIVEADSNILIVYIKEAISRVGKILLLLDGLDDYHKAVAWLVNLEVDNVHVVLTCRKKSQLYQCLCGADGLVTFTVGDLRMKERMEFVRKFFQMYSKSLDESFFNNQLRLLVQKKHAGKPYYLKAACEELRTFGVFEQLSDKISGLGSTIETLVAHIIQRLEMEYSSDLITQILLFIIFAKEGISLTDLQIVLSYWLVTEQDVSFESVTKTEIPSVLVPISWISPVLLSLSPIISQSTDDNGSVYAIRNMVIKAILLNIYETPINFDIITKANNILAGYFYSIVSEGDNCPPHQIKSCLNALLESHHFGPLVELLCCVKFILTTAASGLADYLIHFYVSEIDVHGCKMEVLDLDERLKQYYNFITRNLLALKSKMDIPSLLQLALFEPNDSPICLQAHELKDSHCGYKFVEWENKKAETLVPFMTIFDEKEVINCCCLSQSGHFLAVSGPCMYVDVYNTRSGNRLSRLFGHNNVVVQMLFLSESKLISGCKSGVINLWDFQKGYRLDSVNSHRYGVSAMTFTHGKKYLITVGYDANIMCWKSDNLEKVSSYLVTNRPLSCVATSPASFTVAIGCWDKTIKLWDLNSCQIVHNATGHSGSITDLEYNAAGSQLLSLSPKDGIYFWNATAKSLVCLGKLTNALNCRKLKYLTDFIVTGDDSGGLQFWSQNLGRTVQKTPVDVETTCINVFGDVLWMGARNGTILKYAFTGDNEASIQQPYPLINKRKITSLSILSICVSKKSQSVLVNLGDTFMILNQDLDVIWQPSHCKTQLQYLIFITSNIIAACSYESENVCLWNITSQDFSYKECKGHKGIISCLGTLDDQPLLLAAGQGKGIYAWKIKNLRGDFENNIPDVDCYHDDWINCLASHSDRLVTSSINGVIRIWKYNSGTKFDPVTIFSTMTGGAVEGLTVLDNYILTQLSDEQSGVMDFGGIEVTQLKHKAGSKVGMACSAGAPYFILQRDNFIHTVDVTLGQCVLSCQSHQETVTGLSCSEENTLATISSDLRAHLYKTDYLGAGYDDKGKKLPPVVCWGVYKNVWVTAHSNNEMVLWEVEENKPNEVARLDLKGNPKNVEVYGNCIFVLLMDGELTAYKYNLKNSTIVFEQNIASSTIHFALLVSAGLMFRKTEDNDKHKNFAVWSLPNHSITEHNLSFCNNKQMSSFMFVGEKDFVAIANNSVEWLRYQEGLKSDMNIFEKIVTKSGSWLAAWECYSNHFKDIGGASLTGCCFVVDTLLVSNNKGYISLYKNNTSFTSHVRDLDVLGHVKLHSLDIRVIKTIADDYFCTAGSDLVLSVWQLQGTHAALIKSFPTPGFVSCLHATKDDFFIYIYLAGNWGRIDCFKLEI